jgi:hypothetical protein
MRSWSRFLLIGVLLAVVPAARAQEEGGMTLDEEFARLAEEIPGFGGLYLDKEGTTHVYLQDLSRARDVQDLGERVEVHQGDYDFRDLFAWKDEVRPLLERSGAVFLDIDEQRNRLLFGVERDALKPFDSELQDFLRNTRVPPEAVIVEVGDPFEPQEKLTDKIRPVPMGVQIQRSGFCTFGVNAVRSDVKGFVTPAPSSRCCARTGFPAFPPAVTAARRSFSMAATTRPPWSAFSGAVARAFMSTARGSSSTRSSAASSRPTCPDRLPSVSPSNLSAAPCVR